MTTAQAAERRLRYGANAIIEAPGGGWIAVFVEAFRDPMVWFLVGTAVLFAAIGETADAVVLAAALFPIVAMDAWLHRRTQATVSTLAARLATTATAERDGKLVRIPAIELVPGDLCLVGGGDYAPADGVLLEGEGLQVDESALTGEAMPVRKRSAGALTSDIAFDLDVQNWCSAGTRVLTGEARIRVVYTGEETLYGQIVRMAQASHQQRTPLQSAIGAMVAVLTVVAAALCIALAVIRYSQGFGTFDALLSALALAVAALPEEFPVVFAFFLGVGVYRLAQRQALVRRAVVVESIGRVTCICTDKTGTLTEGQLRLAHVLPMIDSGAADLLRAAATASHSEGGDPLDRVLLDHAEPCQGERLAIFPFTEDRRREVAVLRLPSGELRAVAKGAPETILLMSNLSEADRSSWLSATREWGATGHKVLACGSRDLQEWLGGEPDRGYQFLGLLAFEDAVRQGVPESVAKARSAGIRVIMVTGDHPLTAATVAKEVGIGGAKPRVIEGARLSDALAAARAAAPDFDVIARALPAHKLELVRALRGDMSWRSPATASTMFLRCKAPTLGSPWGTAAPARRAKQRPSCSSTTTSAPSCEPSPRGGSCF